MARQYEFRFNRHGRKTRAFRLIPMNKVGGMLRRVDLLTAAYEGSPALGEPKVKIRIDYIDKKGRQVTQMLPLGRVSIETTGAVIKLHVEADRPARVPVALKSRELRFA